MKKLLIWMLPFLCGCAVAQKQNNPSNYADLITEKTTYAHMQKLATDEMEGRGTGQEGGKKAAEYIASEFRKYGLSAPVNNSYYQEVPLTKRGFTVEDFAIDNQSFTFGKDFFIQTQNPVKTIQSNEIVFIGFGIQDNKYNDLQDIDIKGKVVLFVSDNEPVDSEGKSWITKSTTKSEWTTNRFKRMQELIKKEPKMILSYSPQNKDMLARFGSRITDGRINLTEEIGPQQSSSTEAPIVLITESIIASLFNNTTIDKLISQINETGQPASQLLSKGITATLGISDTHFHDPNVMGLIEGTDKKDEVLVITGHYDHDGINQDGVIFFGADDNASGTVGVLELARAFAQAKKDGNGPRRSILFIALAAEEKGLLGSKYYVNNPVLPLEQTIVNINLDMIGRIDDLHLEGDHNYIHTIGANRSSKELAQINEEVNDKYTKINIDYTYDTDDEPMQLFKRSDQYNFYLKNIPIIFYMSGLHPHYHTPEDTIDKIDFPMMVKREKLIFHTTWEVANREKTLENDLVK